MTIGNSKGAFFDNEFHEAAADWIRPEDPNDDMVVTPDQQRRNEKNMKDLDRIEMEELGGIEVSNKVDDIPIQIDDLLNSHSQGKLTNQQLHKALGAQGYKADLRSPNTIQVWGPDGRVKYFP